MTDWHTGLKSKSMLKVGRPVTVQNYVDYKLSDISNATILLILKDWIKDKSGDYAPEI